MKFIQIPLEMLEDINLTGNDFKVLCFIMRYRNKDTGESFPSIEKIATDTGISIATVKRTIKKLSDQSYFTISKRDGASGRYNIYSNFKYSITRSSVSIDDKKNYSSNKKNKILNFCDFEQREYDYEELEKKLLGWDK